MNANKSVAIARLQFAHLCWLVGFWFKIGVWDRVVYPFERWKAGSGYYHNVLKDRELEFRIASAHFKADVELLRASR